MQKMNKYEKLSAERKRLISNNEAPDWLSTAGYQLLSSKNYLDTGETPKDMYSRVAKRASELTKFEIPSDYGYSNWNEAFFDVLWKGWLSPSTPVLTNLGNERGHPISCSSTYVPDSIRGFYQARTEIAQLTQRGYGTSVCLDTIRPRGSKISRGGTANGVMQLAGGLVDDMKEVSQGSSRRGSVGQYINPLHPDFDEVADRLLNDDDGFNIGWNITDEFEELFKRDPKRADYIWKRMMKIKLTKGKGYFFFLDRANRASPQMYKDRGFTIKNSQLCSEIALMSDENHSYTCALSSANVAKYNEWKDTKLFQIITVFIDAVIEDMLIKARLEEGFEKVVAFTEKSRAQGQGLLGLSTYFQQEGMIFGDFRSIVFNQQLLKRMDKDTLDASKLMAIEVGEPEWMTDYGERCSHRIAIAPTMSTATIMGGVSSGIEPVYANIYSQDTAGGSVYRINPPFLRLMKDRNMYTEEVMTRVAEDQGSVQGETWLTDTEKQVYRTAFEINQETIIRMSSDRQKFGVDQSQSTNLYFTAEEAEEEIARIHDIAFRDEHLLSLYYVRTLNKSMKVEVNKTECEACDG